MTLRSRTATVEPEVREIMRRDGVDEATARQTIELREGRPISDVHVVDERGERIEVARPAGDSFAPEG